MAVKEIDAFLSGKYQSVCVCHTHVPDLFACHGSDGVGLRVWGSQIEHPVALQSDPLSALPVTAVGLQPVGMKRHSHSQAVVPRTQRVQFSHVCLGHRVTLFMDKPTDFGLCDARSIVVSETHGACVIHIKVVEILEPKYAVALPQITVPAKRGQVIDTFHVARQ